MTAICVIKKASHPTRGQTSGLTNWHQKIEFENRKLITAVEDRPGKGWVLAMLAAVRVALVPSAR